MRYTLNQSVIKTYYKGVTMRDHPDSHYEIFTVRTTRKIWEKLLEIARKDERSRTYVVNKLFESFVSGDLKIYNGKALSTSLEKSFKDVTKETTPKPKPYFKNFKSHLLVTDHLSEEEKDRLREVGIIKDPDNPDSFEYKVAHQDELIASGQLAPAAPPECAIVREAPKREPRRAKSEPLSADQFADPTNISPSEVPADVLAAFNDPKEE